MGPDMGDEGGGGVWSCVHGGVASTREMWTLSVTSRLHSGLAVVKSSTMPVVSCPKRREPLVRTT